MKYASSLIAMSILFALPACAIAQPAATASTETKIGVDVRSHATAGRHVPVIIRLNVPEAATPALRAAAISAATDRVIAAVPAGSMEVIRRYRIVPIIAASVNSAALEALARLPDVRQVVLDEVDQVLLDKSTLLIQANRVWPSSNGAGRLVAILDDGTDSRHPFVRGRVSFEACFRRDKKCRNGKATQFGTGAARNMSKSHGMHVAGIAAGSNGKYKTRRLNGVAPGAGIIATNVFSSTGSFASDQVAALEYVAELRASGVQVVASNMSLGAGKFTSACDAQEEDRTTIINHLLSIGVATVIAAGNNGYSNAVTRPGCISSAVTVSTSSDSDALYTGQNRSSLTDLVAPGITIWSSVPDSIYGGQGLGDYQSKSGTSMATPHVTGAFALLSAAAPQATAQQILAALIRSGRLLRDPANGRKYPRIDLDDALARLRRP